MKNDERIEPLRKKLVDDEKTRKGCLAEVIAIDKDLAKAKAATIKARNAVPPVVKSVATTEAAKAEPEAE